MPRGSLVPLVLPLISAALDIVVIAVGVLWGGAAVGWSQYQGWFTLPAYAPGTPCGDPGLVFQVRPRPDADEAAFRRALVYACPSVVDELAKVPKFNISHPPMWVQQLDWDAIERRVTESSGLGGFIEEARIRGTSCLAQACPPLPHGAPDSVTPTG